MFQNLFLIKKICTCQLYMLIEVQSRIKKPKANAQVKMIVLLLHRLKTSFVSRKIIGFEAILEKVLNIPLSQENFCKIRRHNTKQDDF